MACKRSAVRSRLPPPVACFILSNLIQNIRTDEEWINYLNECIMLDEGDGRLIRMALDDMTRAKGLIRVAKKANMTRQGLGKTLSEEGNPALTTFINILKALNLKLTIAHA